MYSGSYPQSIPKPQTITDYFAKSAKNEDDNKDKETDTDQDKSDEQEKYKVLVFEWSGKGEFDTVDHVEFDKVNRLGYKEYRELQKRQDDNAIKEFIKLQEIKQS